MYITLDDPRAAEDLAANWVAENVRVQAFAQARSFGKFEDAAVVNDSSTDIAAAQWDDPAPPAMSHEMVRRPRAGGATCPGVIGKTFAPVVTIPILHAAKSCPDRVDRVLVVLTKMAELTREHGCPSGCIDNPAAAHRALFNIDHCIHCLSVSTVQVALGHLCWTPKIAAGSHRALKQMRIQFRSIHLKRLQPRLITCSNLDTVIEALVRPLAEPKSQPLFSNLMVAEMVGKTQNARHVTTAHFGG